MSTVKAPGNACMPGDGRRDIVAVHAGTARIISDTIDRIFGVAHGAGQSVKHAERETVAS
jgi:hypothetical protein